MAPTRNRSAARAVRAVVVAASVVAPLIAAAPTAGAGPGQCLAWFGSRDEGTCLSYSNGSPSYVGTPNLGIYGPAGVGNPGVGIITGPMLPGQTINVPIG